MGQHNQRRKEQRPPSRELNHPDYQEQVDPPGPLSARFNWTFSDNLSPCIARLPLPATQNGQQDTEGHLKE